MHTYPRYLGSASYQPATSELDDLVLGPRFPQPPAPILLHVEPILCDEQPS